MTASRIAQLEAALATERATLVTEREERRAIEAERDRLRAAYEALKQEVELAKHRITIAKAERIDTTQLELEFASKLAAFDAMCGLSAPEVNDNSDDDGPPLPKGDGRKKRRGGGGRRDLKLVDLPVTRIEIVDPALEGTAKRIGVEETWTMGWRRAGYVRIQVVRHKYKVPGAPSAEGIPGKPEIVTAERPLALLPRSLATPSLFANIAVEKFCWVRIFRGRRNMIDFANLVLSDRARS